ncbi:DUF1236 domain-containing protein [Pseudaminobacter sp. NGMCC 1.201702]|uniref:DUF1236 domain-containing protein n=1 Tax=Pseudaminobacter sp. NGMCC 1.201702 TaxID=3391825 RepID=UPI0039F03C22
MKIQLAAGLLIVASASTAFAQDIIIAPEQETVIREYVVREKVAPIELPGDVQVTVGTVLPETTELQAVEAPDIDTQYSYIVVDGQTVLVDPGTRKIIHIMK